MKYLCVLFVFALACGDPAFSDDCPVKCSVGETTDCGPDSLGAVVAICVPRDDSVCNKFQPQVLCSECSDHQCKISVPDVCEERCYTNPPYGDPYQPAYAISCTTIEGMGDQVMEVLVTDESCRMEFK